ncbi:TetR family transcriptional regulator [Mycobacterium stomatepiae]|uniref:TetR family transcriptional regulator n=2 Tax=Mycobacterium stomatepiae TaxID=470076 RepID=A0A7I7Q257_9MYCO|nr:TetR family transcriptional regulator [Mycobacterium stomatepiae]
MSGTNGLKCQIDEGEGMPSANTGSLRDRRRAELVSQIRQTAQRLFAERGFDAVTTEEIAAAAGVSISTYFRYAPTKETLLVGLVREASAEIVESYSARPPDESPVEALIRIFVARAKEVTEVQKLDTWRQAVATAPRLLSQSVLVTETERRQFVAQVASRMGVDAAADIRPALLVHTSLATAKFVIDRWLAQPVDGPEFHVQLEEALRMALTGFD